MLRVIEVTSHDTFDKINRLLAAREALLAFVATHKQFRRPEQLVQKVFSQPITRIKHIAQEGLYAENTARNYLNKLAELGVVEKTSAPRKPLLPKPRVVSHFG